METILFDKIKFSYKNKMIMTNTNTNGYLNTQLVLFNHLNVSITIRKFLNPDMSKLFES